MVSVEVPPVEKQLLASSGIGSVEARFRRIMSVHFEKKEIQFFHSGRRKFVLEEGAAEKPTFIDVYDSVQPVQDLGHLATKDVNEQASMPFLQMPVPVDVIVADCLTNWCRSGLGVRAKNSAGIIVLEGVRPTEVELNRANGMETKLCRALVEEADQFWAKKDGIIEGYHRKALLWLGSERKPWYEEIRLGKTKTSAISGNKVPMEALADGGIELMEFYIKNGLRPEDFGDTFVQNLFKNSPEVRKTIRTRLGMN